MHSTQGNGGMK